MVPGSQSVTSFWSLLFAGGLKRRRSSEDSGNELLRCRAGKPDVCDVWISIELLLSGELAPACRASYLECLHYTFRPGIERGKSKF